MKVSRKVGRRSRKHTSSISRRRLRSKKSYKKNSYRKKYTQKGGCWGPSNKGGARGRKYKRVRTHTHKRGKRFHRGGAEDCNLEFTDWIQGTETGTTTIFDTFSAKSISDISLTYKKKGSLMEATSDFSVEIKIKKQVTSIGSDNYISEIVFTRKTNPVVKYTIGDITLSELIFQIEDIERGDNVAATLIRGYLSNSTSVYGLYNFSFPSNLPCFKKIRDKIKEKTNSTSFSQPSSLQPSKTQDFGLGDETAAITA